MKQLFLIAVVLSSAAFAGNARDRKITASTDPAGDVKACEYEARVKQFDCLDLPGSHTECFLGVINQYDTCCREKALQCPSLKF